MLMNPGLETQSLTYFDAGDIAELDTLIDIADRIVITTHRKPDGDAMGSALGLWHVLRKLGKEVTIVSPTAYDPFLEWMPGTAEVVDATAKPFDASKLASKADIIFCLDFSGLDRLESFRQDVEESPAHKVVVDHHIDPEPFARLYFHRVAASSTAELIYRLIEDLGLLPRLDADIAQCLYTGIMTDTGSFRFPSTTADVHFIVGNLLRTGINVGEIHRLVYDNFSESRLRFMGYVLNEKMVVLPEYHTAYMVLTLEEQERFAIKPGDDEGLVNYNLSIKGINFAALIKEGTDRIRMSFRSQGSFPCNEFAGNFGGGGHKNASGGKSEENLEKTIAKFLGLLDTYKQQLEQSV